MNIKKLMLSTLAVAAAAVASTPQAEACSRVLYRGDSTLLIVGRSLDWKTPIPTNLYVYPRGMAKQGSPAPNAVKWTSKYGAVYAVGYDGGITEGMNEKGLVINGLFCKGTVYSNDSVSGRPPMSLAMFIGWLLDMNATTPEVVKVLREQNFDLSGASFDGGTTSTLHWGITDAEGRSAILEFDHGNVRVYEGTDMPVMTNDPPYPQMMAIEDYWEKVGGVNMLPGTVKSPDRFVRGTFFANHVERTDDRRIGLAIIRSILMNVSVPYQYTAETEPNVSSTQWRSFANLTDRLYYFDIVTNPGLVYVDLGKMDLRSGQPVRKLDTSTLGDAAGEVNSMMKVSEGFKPMY
ncbi:linear amide C-N hydrolase [Paramuribaculum intestinale]|uniref:linear amide C-N hydrolase n=1 Tax=Paramuribaculum intestinale TaxID=2094151 RepID=UPI002729B750|nr:linear amide C-N hydrolase [Paramuribaculum intestinale]